MKFMSSIPVISQTFIEALRCAEAVLLESALISPIVSSYIRDVLNGIHSTLPSSIQPFLKEVSHINNIQDIAINWIERRLHLVW